MNLSKKRNLIKSVRRALSNSKSPFLDMVIDIGILDPDKNELIEIGPISIRDFIAFIFDKEI